jgi:type II secretory pathway pseudopilin PulG
MVRRLTRRREAGYTYLLLLFAVAAMGLVAAAAAENWSTLAQRERERELLFVGNQYREALRRYSAALPDAPQRYPAKLEDLLQDPRLPGTRRYLRKIYADPLSGQADWALLRQGEGIVGLHSRAGGRPLKQGGFDKRDEDFAGAASYADWKFAAAAGTPDAATVTATGTESVAKPNIPSAPVAVRPRVAQP